MSPTVLRKRRVTALVIAAVVAALTTAFGVLPAHATQPGITIIKSTATPDTVTTVIRLDGAALDAGADPSSAAMTFDGTELSTTAKAAGETTQLDQVAMLAMDTSGSMRGSGITAAKSAANSFLQSVPSQVRIGLVTFNDSARVVVAPTTDRAKVAAAVNDLGTSGATALYDGVTLAAKQVSTADVATVLLLSDGVNKGGTADLSQAVTAAKDSGATFDAVSIGSADSQVAPLRAIADATSGTVTTSAADSAALTDAFDQTAKSITNQYVVTGDLPSTAGSSGNVTVSMTAGGQTYSDVAFVQVTAAQPQAGATTPVAVAPSGALGSFAGRSLGLALIVLFVGLVVIIGYSITATSERQRSGGKIRSRLSVYTLTGRSPVKEEETTALGDSQVARSAVEFANKVVARRDLESVVGEQLESAGVPLKAAEWMIIHIGVAIGAAMLFFFVFGGKPLPTLLGLGLGLIAPWTYLSVKRDRRLKAFMSQLPDTLQLMAGSLAAGYSMPQAVDTVVREGEPPISSEFNRALIEARLGVPLEDALDGIAVRMRSLDFTWVVMAIRIQREVGGNLAEILNTVAATLRERERLRRQVSVLSAEGRLSAWILGLLPVVFAVYLILARPEYLQPLVTQPIGWVLMAVGVILMFIGAFWLRRVVKVEV